MAKRVNNEPLRAMAERMYVELILLSIGNRFPLSAKNLTMDYCSSKILLIGNNLSHIKVEEHVNDLLSTMKF